MKKVKKEVSVAKYTRKPETCKNCIHHSASQTFRDVYHYCHYSAVAYSGTAHSRSRRELSKKEIATKCEHYVAQTISDKS